MKPSQQEYWATIANALVSTEGLSWQKPWTLQGGELPINGNTDKVYKPYRGSNSMVLTAIQIIEGLSNRWFPTKGLMSTAKKAGIRFSHPNDWKHRTIMLKSPPRFKEDKKTGERVYAGGGCFWVINYDDLHLVFGKGNIPSYLEEQPKGEKETLPEDRFSKLFESISLSNVAGLKIETGGDRAYNLNTLVKVPTLESFSTHEGALSTMFHELAHWTGHRLERDMGGKFGSERYAKEELVAELSALLLGREVGFNGTGFGLSHTSENGLAYLASWLKKFPTETRAELMADAYKSAQKAKKEVLLNIKPIAEFIKNPEN